MNATNSRAILGSLAALIVVITACGGSDKPADSPSASSTPVVDSVAFAEAFEVLRVVTLEETDEVVTVTPRVTTDRPGELLVTEPQEAQVRVYDRDGSLKSVIGRRGAGPGEFQMPISARRTGDDRIVVPDVMLSRITFLDVTRPDSVETFVATIQPVLDVQDLGGGRFLLSGIDASSDQPNFLHIWNPQTNQIERSFLPMMDERGRMFASTSATIEADTIWAVWALSDTLYKYNRNGDEIDKILMTLPRPGAELPTSELGTIVSEEAMAGFSDVTQVVSAFPVGSDIAIQTAQMRGREAEYDLMIIDREGQVKYQLIASQRLLFVDGDELYFADPTSLLPNRITVAKRRTAP